MTNKLNPFVTLLLLGVFSTACEEPELEETAIEGISVVDNASASNVVFAETFEGPAPFCNAHNTGFGKSHSFSVVNDPAFSGDKAGCFKLKASDPMVSSGTRAEVTVVKEEVKKEMWYSFAVRFPADGYAFDSQKEIISQWHQLADVHLGEKPQSPATHLVIQKDRFILDTGYNTQKVSDGVDPDKRKSFDLGPVTKDTWHTFVFHFIHSYKSDGLIEVWHNGKKMLTHKSGNMYNSADMPKWKLGIYKWKWNGNGTTDTKKRILYYDNIKVGTAKATLADMAPDNTSTLPPAPVGDTFTFVNAETDEDIMTVTQGALLSQHALGTKKISVRANPQAPEIQSVKFVLKGPKDQTFIDDKKPFALFGDDGQGNYYYGNYLPVGEYSLQVTPYTEAKGKGKAGTTFKANFTIKKY
jgi:Polysaccharide lyase